MIKYIGSKRKLIADLVSTVETLPEVETVLDLFSGTSRVGSALRARGYRVTANDHNAYAYTLARCYIAVDPDEWTAPAAAHIARLNGLTGAPGYFTRTY